jgi:hypothetical protein
MWLLAATERLIRAMHRTLRRATRGAAERHQSGSILSHPEQPRHQGRERMSAIVGVSRIEHEARVPRGRRRPALPPKGGLPREQAGLQIALGRASLAWSW